MTSSSAVQAHPAGDLPSIAILTASYNDWPSLRDLLPMLDAALAGKVSSAEVVVIDDGSAIPPPPDLLAGQSYQVVRRVHLVSLVRNLGSQRALSVGVGWAANHLDCDFLAVMDCDHEDRPEVVPELLAAAQAKPGHIVFAARTRRHEGAVFKAFYAIYKRLYQVLTGMQIAIGNFSITPRPLIRRLAGVWEIGVHFPAGVMKAKLPYATIGAARGKRRHGKSNLNFVNFVIHGASGLAVHSEVVAVRAVLATIGLTAISCGYMLYALFEKFVAHTTPLGWTSQILAIFGGMLFQALVSGLLLLFIVLNARNQRPFIPLRDWAVFVLESEELAFAGRETSELALPGISG